MITWLKNVWRRWLWDVEREKMRVPLPDWAAKRGGREYW
jgi:hypothetical protein